MRSHQVSSPAGTSALEDNKALRILFPGDGRRVSVAASSMLIVATLNRGHRPRSLLAATRRTRKTGNATIGSDSISWSLGVPHNYL